VQTIQLLIEYYPENRSKQRIVTFKIEPEKLEKIDQAAQLLGLNRSELIREAITHYINNILQQQATLKNPHH